MKRIKNFKLIAGTFLLLLSAGLITGGIFLFKKSAHEITRAELSQAIQQKQIVEGRALPTPYSGIYRVEGVRKTANAAEKFYVTTHLGEAEVKSLFEQNAIKIEMP